MHTETSAPITSAAPILTVGDRTYAAVLVPVSAPTEPVTEMTPAPVQETQHPLAHLKGRSVARGQLPLARIYDHSTGKVKGVFWVGENNGELKFGACAIKQNGRLYRRGKYDGTIWRHLDGSSGRFDVR